MKKIIILILTLFGLFSFSSCQSKKKESSETNAANLEIDIGKVKYERIDTLFTEFKYRYHQLMSSPYFRSSLKFDDSWIKDLERLNQKSGHELFNQKGVSFQLLKDLALAYGRSKGLETAYTINIKRIIENAIALNKDEKRQYATIIESSDFEVNFLNPNIDSEIIKVVNRFRKIDKLYADHYAIRDSIMPLFWELCPKYFKLLVIRDSLRKPLIDSIIQSMVSNKLKMTNNQRFLNSLITQMSDTSLITIEKAIAPVFNIKKNSIGIYNSGNYNSGDEKLLRKTGFFSEIRNEMIPSQKIYLYQNVIDSLYVNPKRVFLYSNKNMYESTVKKFGKYIGECFEYYYYECNTNSAIINEKEFMFASPFKLDLTYVNDSKADSLINSNFPNLCYDCPNSWHMHKTFAKLNGFENLYFTYSVEPGKEIDDTYTPLRALYYVKNNLIIKLWSDSIDLFGCGCL
jgi:hypothetical protein